MNSLEIARKAKPIQITEVAQKVGLHLDEIEVFGNYKAKVSLKVLDRFFSRPPAAKLICVTGMTPTKEGDGKTCTSVGLTEALGILKKKVILCLREPSLAPIFGFKGGATGGGYAQVLPMEDINLHFTGDFHAIQSAHNLLSAVLENHIHHGNALGIDPEHIFWRRTLDMSDRQLRNIIVGVSKTSHFPQYKTGFDITAASEVMGCASLSNSIPAFKSKLNRISIGLNKEGRLVTAKDLKAAGAMALLLKDAIKPNLVQTYEGQPVFIHTGPFANVSHGNNSLMATTIAMKLANYVVTESGFAADLGLEKMFDVVCREGNLRPSVSVIVVSVKAIKSHGSMVAGFENIQRHIQNIGKFGVPVIVAINRFPSDTDEEIKTIKDKTREWKVECAVSDAVKLGGRGALELAEKVVKVTAEQPSNFKPFYELDVTTEQKIEKIAKELYGADGVDYTDEGRKDLESVHRLKLDNLPVVIAKTPYSFSDNPELKGAPSGWRLTVRAIRPYTGAGFLVVLSGTMVLMPGLPEKPMLEQMDLTDDGQAQGLF